LWANLKKAGNGTKRKSTNSLKVALEKRKARTLWCQKEEEHEHIRVGLKRKSTNSLRVHLRKEKHELRVALEKRKSTNTFEVVLEKSKRTCGA
jgi:hypothetical protein